MANSEQATTLTLSRYADDSRSLVQGAQSLADARKHAEVQPLHLLARGLERDPGVLEVFRRATPRHMELASAVEKALDDLPLSREPAYLSVAMLDLLERAQREADRERSQNVLVEHLLNALSQEIRGPAGELLGAFGLGPGGLRPHMKALHEVPRGQTAPTSSDGESGALRDLIAEARQGDQDPVIGRVAEVRRLVTILERRQKSHPLLVGEPGVGKRAVVRALAQRIAAGDIPTRLANLRLLEVDSGRLVAGARLRGELEQRVKQLLDRALDFGAEAVLVLNHVEQLFGQGPAGSAVGDLLRPALSRGDVRWLGLTTPEGVRRVEERDAQALRLFTTLSIDEPGAELATEIVRGIAARLERHHQVDITESAIVASVRLAKRYLQDRFLPDTAIDLLDEAAAAKRVEVDGIPREMDEAIARLGSLKAQLATLEDAQDQLSKDTVLRLRSEADALEPTVRDLRERLEARRGGVTQVVELREQLVELERELAKAGAAKDYARVGKIEHAEKPALERKLAEAEMRAQAAGVSASRELGEEDVAATLALWTGVPVQKMLEGEAEKLLKMEQRLSQRVVGQDDAVTAIARAVRRGRVGLRDPKKPIGSFLFLGPSGVGKTELAKALAAFLFDDEAALTRLDMSEFMERHMAQRLIGAPPGYADAEKGGFLTEAVRRRPYSVLLFDEVEKAHSDVFNLLLQVLDDGRLTDGRGRAADFSNTVVIMTSNIGSARILETDSKLFETPDGREALRDVLLENLNQFFRPEFLNRVDDVVVFRPLTTQVLRKIVDIELSAVERLLAERRVTLEVSDAVKDHLVELGYEPALGARPLKRAILREVQDPLAEALLSGDYPAGSKVVVDLEAERLTFERGQ